MTKFEANLLLFLFQMLTEEQRIILSKTASDKYQLDINSTQIAHLILDNFECNFYFGGEKNFITGKVTNFRKFPLRMDFDAPEGSPDRKVLKNHFDQTNSKFNLEFKCKLSSVSNTVKTNTLSISSSEFQEMGIKEKLLGPATSAYVSRYCKGYVFSFFLFFFLSFSLSFFLS